MRIICLRVAKQVVLGEGFLVLGEKSCARWELEKEEEERRQAAAAAAWKAFRS